MDISARAISLAVLNSTRYVRACRPDQYAAKITMPRRRAPCPRWLAFRAVGPIRPVGSRLDLVAAQAYSPPQRVRLPGIGWERSKPQAHDTLYSFDVIELHQWPRRRPLDCQPIDYRST